MKLFMENKYVIDSSVFIALYYEEDINHKRALEIFEELEMKVLIIHPFVIQEVATVLTYKISKQLANSFLKDLDNSFNTTVSSSSINYEINFFLKQESRLSFTDTSLIALAKAQDAALITFDKKMLSLYQKEN